MEVRIKAPPVRRTLNSRWASKNLYNRIFIRANRQLHIKNDAVTCSERAGAVFVDGLCDAYNLIIQCGGYLPNQGVGNAENRERLITEVALANGRRLALISV